MKKIVVFIITLLYLPVSLISCSGQKDKENSGNSVKLQVVSTIFPSYDFAKQICGDKAEIMMLLPPGSESHSYEPTPKDILKIQNCDLFIYVGGESDAWVDSILESMDKRVKTLKMMDAVNAVEEEIVEGMESEDEQEDSEDELKEKEHEYDEHVWTSPKNAIQITQSIAEAVEEIDTDNSAFYQANTKRYIKELQQLDDDFTTFFQDSSIKNLVFGDRFPFRYFADEYNLDYYAAFPGCASNTEPSAATVAFLIDKVKKEKVKTVFYIEFSNHKVADSIAEATGTKTALFHSCHNVTREDRKNGVTYLSLMQKNLETLKEVLQ